jgi:hypothetical protein
MEHGLDSTDSLLEDEEVLNCRDEIEIDIKVGLKIPDKKTALKSVKSWCEKTLYPLVKVRRKKAAEDKDKKCEGTKRMEM